MVLGTPTTGRPSSNSSAVAASVPSPPTLTIASMPLSASVWRTRSTPLGTPYGCTRDVPSIVPPRGNMPRTRSMSRRIQRSSITPNQPS